MENTMENTIICCELEGTVRIYNMQHGTLILIGKVSLTDKEYLSRLEIESREKEKEDIVWLETHFSTLVNLFERCGCSREAGPCETYKKQRLPASNYCDICAYSRWEYLKTHCAYTLAEE